MKNCQKHGKNNKFCQANCSFFESERVKVWFALKKQENYSRHSLVFVKEWLWANRSLHSFLIKELREWIAHGRSLRREILSERVKSERAKSQPCFKFSGSKLANSYFNSDRQHMIPNEIPVKTVYIGCNKLGSNLGPCYSRSCLLYYLHRYFSFVRLCVDGSFIQKFPMRKYSMSVPISIWFRVVVDHGWMMRENWTANY